MQCVILAAGMGTRLRARAPVKPLAPVAGVALIDRVVEAARAGGATRFVVATGYEAARLEAHLAGRAEIVRNEEWEKPNGHSVLAAAGRLDERFLLLMADHLFDPAIVRDLIGAASGHLTLAVDRRLDNPLVDPDDATKVELATDGRIVRIGKTLDRYDAFDTGIFVATPALAEAIRESIARGGSGSLSEGVQALADEAGAFTLEIGGRWWIDVDDEAALLRAEDSLRDISA